MTITLAPPRVFSYRNTRYPYSDLFLSHFDAVLIRAAYKTLLLPSATQYVVDLRDAPHALGEVLLRRHATSITHVLASGRFPHGVLRLRPLLRQMDAPVLDVRPTSLPVHRERPKDYLLTHPLDISVPDQHFHGAYLTPATYTRPTFAQDWAHTLAMVPTGLVVLEAAQRGEEAVVHALEAIRALMARRRAPSPASDSVKEMTPRPNLHGAR